MAGVNGPDSVWAGRVTPGLVAAFEAGRARLGPAGLTVALVQVRWREPVGAPWMEPACFRWLVRLLGATRRRRRLSPSVRVTVRVTEGPDGRPDIDIVTRPGRAAHQRRG
ncbi:hypothetical protein [Brevundimonas sp. Root1423]|uniref:hypothetical protein n=1 Tax=Brevundimonas sp. Root1423 TaxID=1736462 RepID=UPI0006F37189|nr:hypothetical protein [Brevundimonas sp. Root1423]KQY84605.1 hypothetical protein ASD25_06055 [Brevundimonas sp. Root1423]